MKRILVLLVSAITAIAMLAQKDVTTFLGIPVDGTKTAMKQKLVAKGFKAKSSMKKEFFVGEFNGSKVNIYIVTNKNKVCRLLIVDETTQNEAGIIKRLAMIYMLSL